MREANLILEEVVDNSKLAQDAADYAWPPNSGPWLGYTEKEHNKYLKDRVEKRLNSSPEMAQELLQFLDSPTATAGVVGALVQLDKILSKYMD